MESAPIQGKNPLNRIKPKMLPRTGQQAQHSNDWAIPLPTCHAEHHRHHTPHLTTPCCTIHDTGWALNTNKVLTIPDITYIVHHTWQHHAAPYLTSPTWYTTPDIAYIIHYTWCLDHSRCHLHDSLCLTSLTEYIPTITHIIYTWHHQHNEPHPHNTCHH